ncbi:Holliday junction resolvase RuvX [Wenzhouxiangella sp. XN201]|uniref:Holliday junction resolvase RuvX n=1 Tax=Wenzhouxiangella sp. XN201 TaxID=2710755 RepID=UPI0013CBEC0A|nr:Holliday junction resolvase RuvX [Wenzhouxiangella sp. XN201]NEZ02872.1 Holliday junction resolvase RuvX [Wenzhouxiangella sp. XN201]
MPEPAGTLLGIDFGLRTVGLAVGHHLTGSARPLEPIRYRDTDSLMEQLDDVLSQWRPALLVIGLPLGGDGDESDMSRRVRDFASRLAKRHDAIDIRFHDERLTSHAAAEHHASRRQQGRAKRRDAERLDSVAASLILESWMGEHP